MVLGGPMVSKGLSKHHLSAKNCLGFVVISTTYNISGDDPMLLTTPLYGVPQMM